MTTDNKDFVTDWQGKIKAGRNFRKRFSTQKEWKDYREYYRGEWDDDIIPVNRMFSFGRALMPQVYFRAPRVSVTATHPDLVFHARVVEAVDNWLIKEAMLKGTLKTAILNAYICGTAPIKLGFDSEFGYDPRLAVDEDSATVTQQAKKDSRIIEYKTNVKPGLPWALSVQPEDVVVPYGFKSPNFLLWIAHRIIRPLDDLKEDSKYSNTKDLKGSRILDLAAEGTPKVPGVDENEIDYAELWEIRDASRKSIYTICEDELLLSDDDALQIEGLPWEFLIFNEDPEHFWGIPDIKMIKAQQLELNEIKTQASKHRKIALLKFLVKKGIMKEPEAEKFLSGEVGPWVEIDDDMVLNAVAMIQPHVPPDLAIATQQAKQDMLETMGQGENQLGAFSPYHGKTATETMEVSNASGNRSDERKDIVADLLTSIIRKWNQFIFSFWTSERVVQIAGPSGAENWIKYTGEQLTGEYSLKIDPDSGFPVNKTTKLQAADGLMKQYGGDPLIEQTMLRRQHLEQYEFIFPGATRLLKELPPELANAAAGERQPGVAGGGGGGAGSTSQGNRGGGRSGGPQEFEQAKKAYQEGGG